MATAKRLDGPGSGRRGTALLAAALGAAWLAAAGCSTPPRAMVHTFDRAPTDWSEVGEEGPGGAASLDVRDHHLLLRRRRTVMAPRAFEAPTVSVDVAITGGDRRGLAGLFLVGEGGGEYEVVAVRGSGQWRSYRSPVPWNPRGGRGWRPSGERPPTGYWRLALRLDGAEVVLSIDGREVARRKAEPVRAAGSDPSEPARWRVGLFTLGVDTRWNNFIGAEVEDLAALPPLDSLEDWGGAATAERLVGEFRETADRFESRPSRDGIFALAASLEGALAASHSDLELNASACALAEETAGRLRSAARRIGEAALLADAFESVARSEEARRALLGVGGKDWLAEARAAEEEGRVVDALVAYATLLEVEETNEVRERFEALRSEVRPLSFGLEVDDAGVETPVITAETLSDAARAVYGRLARSEGGDLWVDVIVERSVVEKVDDRATRRVVVSAAGHGLPPGERDELSALEESFPAELDEAVIQGKVLRLGAESLGPSSLALLRKVRIGDDVYELQVDRGRELAAAHRRLVELRKKKRLADAAVERTETVSGVRRTVSVLVRTRTTVEYGDRVLVDSKEQRAYAGIVQWKHPADPARGIDASSIRRSDLVETVRSVRQRILTGFRTLISRESIVGALPEASRLEFLLRLALASPQSEHVDGFKWLLQKTHGMDADLRDRVTDRLLER